MPRGRGGGGGGPIIKRADTTFKSCRFTTLFHGAHHIRRRIRKEEARQSDRPLNCRRVISHNGGREGREGGRYSYGGGEEEGASQNGGVKSLPAPRRAKMKRLCSGDLMNLLLMAVLMSLFRCNIGRGEGPCQPVPPTGLEIRPPGWMSSAKAPVRMCRVRPRDLTPEIESSLGAA